MKIMIIDDEPAVLQALEMLIDWPAIGYEPPKMLPNAIEALEVYQAYAPDVILTDINMPSMDGLEMIRTLRQEGWHKPIVIISGHDEFDYAKKAMQYHVEDYILKPIDEDELSNVLVGLNKAAKKDYEDFPQDSITYKVLSYIHKHYKSQLKLKTLADEFHISSAYLGQIIKKATGKLFNDYILDIRMAVAMDCLRTTDAMIYEVAERCGYQDTDYFIKKFTIYVGCSPNTYKKNKGVIDA